MGNRRMKLNFKLKRKPIIPVNSMSDIAFLLLIFIMLLSLINYRREIKIDYPEAEFREVVQSDNNFEIWVNREGNVFVEGKYVDAVTLEHLIVDEVVRDPLVRIHLIADKNTEYKNINNVIEILKLLQHRVVSLVVKENNKE
jgi:biopolymer transport protein ExbD